MILSRLALTALLLSASACASNGRPPTTEETRYETSWAHYPDVIGEDGRPRSDFDTEPEIIGGMGSLERLVDAAGQGERCAVSGRVILSVLVDEAGRVAESQLARGIGGGCDEVALEASRGLQFRPATDGGEPKKSVFSFPIRFQ